MRAHTHAGLTYTETSARIYVEIRDKIDFSQFREQFPEGIVLAPNAPGKRAIRAPVLSFCAKCIWIEMHRQAEESKRRGRKRRREREEEITR